MMEPAIHLTRVGPARDDNSLAGPVIVLSLATAKLLFHLLTAGRYGIFRDELYYLACSEHLAFGYVDQPPLIAVVAWLSRHLFGESLLGLRLLPAFAGAATVWLSGKLAREMGGRAFAQALAALAVIATPIFLLMHHWLTMNAFEPLIWLGCAWCVVRAINQGDPRYWLCFGVLLGLGMENKYTAAFFALAVFVALFLTPQRRFLSNAWIWIGALCAFLIFVPNLIWLIRHDFPFLELMRNIRGSGRDVVRGPIAFVLDQAMTLNPILFPLWLGGLGWLFLNRNGGRYRILGWTYLLMLVSFIVLKGKNYYLSPAYPMLFAAGAVAFERMTRERGRWSRAVYAVLIVISTCLLAPTVAPILPPETYIRYQKAIGLEPPKAENQSTGPLPQYFADEFGWEEIIAAVNQAYSRLSPEERAGCGIFAQNYGQAGAIDFFGGRYGLPPALSGHQTYFLWGPRSYSGNCLIVLDDSREVLEREFEHVEYVGKSSDNPYAMEREIPTFICRGAKFGSLAEIWPRLKRWR